MTQAYRTTIHKQSGDLLTPVLLFSRLQGQQKFLLESSAKYSEHGRYSFIGTNPRKTYRGQGTTLTEISHKTAATYTYEGELISLLKQVMPRIVNRTDYPFTGGAIGTIQSIDGVLHANFQVYDTLIIFDHLTEELVIIHTNIEAEEQQIALHTLIAELCAGNPTTFEQYSINGAQIAGDLFTLYRDLRVASPAPYMFYLEQETRHVIGTAPASFISVHDGHVTTAAPTDLLAAVYDAETLMLRPTAHAIDALAAVAPTLQRSGAVGYIGFNGQIDFAPCTHTIFIEQQRIVCDDAGVTQQLKG